MKDIEEIKSVIVAIQSKLDEGFWIQPEFWIGALIGIVGLAFSLLAYVEARQAKSAALAAGEFIQIQSITIELNELLHLLQSISSETEYKDARDILTQVNIKLRRYLASYRKKPEYEESCKKIFDSLQHATKALSDVKPSDPALGSSGYGVVFSGIESSFSVVGGHVAELMGLFERRAIDGDGE